MQFAAFLWREEVGKHTQQVWHTSSVVPFPRAQMSGQELGNPGLTLSPLKTNGKMFMDFLLLKEGGSLPPD